MRIYSLGVVEAAGSSPVTQAKKLAERLEILPQAVSKWERPYIIALINVIFMHIFQCFFV